MDPKSKIALITGGAMGLGLAYARILLQNGANVMICDLNKTQGEEAIAQLKAEFGVDRVKFMMCDVTKSGDFEDVFKETVSTFGGLHILINNAGIYNDELFKTEVLVNVSAVAEGTLQAFQYMNKSQGGVVVNISSILGLQPFPRAPIYAATKHAIIGMSRSFGDKFHYDQTGVRVVTLCPGMTDTTLISEVRNKKRGTERNKNCGESLAAFPSQKVENVAEAMLHLVREAENGTVWVSEGGEPVYRIMLPDRHTLKV